MKCIRILCLLFLLVFSNQFLHSQNENNKWYFGMHFGLDFMTSPPTLLANGTMTSTEGCSSVCDAAGSLLFYTNGVSIWNQNHTLMANGTGLTGDVSTSQSVLIAKRPGSNSQYFVFTLGAWGTGTLAYSIVDMSLASGMGSVTTKNSQLAANCTERLACVRHCNGTDAWLVSHDYGSADFRSFLVTNAGVSATPTISTAGTSHSLSFSFAGCMKISPNGKKLGIAMSGYTSDGKFELFDFDNSTGAVSNALALYTPIGQISPYGCEFSPDGTKLYGATVATNSFLYQWDLCAGSNTAIVSSRQSIYAGYLAFGGMQLASDGKIYIARENKFYLGLINSPNLTGTACNYVEQGISTGTFVNDWSISNFMAGRIKGPFVPFSSTLSCNSATFNAPIQATLNSSCQGLTFSLSAVAWDFGDPASGSANTSSLSNPVHDFSSGGTFTTQVILFYGCGGGADTIRQVIQAGGPVVNVSGSLSICKGDKRSYIASGASTYSWSTGASSSSISVSPSVTTSYTLIGTDLTNTCSSQKVFTVLVKPCVGIISQGEPDQQNIKIYPNPNADFIFIESESPVRIFILNQQGELVVEAEFESGTNKVDISILPDGVYFLKSLTASCVSTRRIVKISN